MQLNAVVLPAPFGPIRPTISHWSTRRSSPSTAVRPPKRMVRSRTSSTDIAALHRCDAVALMVVQREPAPAEPARERADHLAETAGVQDDRLQQQCGPDRVRDVELVVQVEGVPAAVTRDPGQDRVDESEEDRCRDDTAPVGQTADDGDHDERQCQVEARDTGEVLVREQLRPERERGARETGHRPREGEAEQLVAEHVDAERGGDLLVVTKSDEAAAHLRAPHADVDVVAEDDQHEREQVEGVVAGQRGGPVRRHTRVLAVERGQREDRVGEDAAEDQRDERQVEAADAQRDRPEDDRRGTGRRRCGGEPDGEHERVGGRRTGAHHVGGRQRAEADERLVTERDLAGVAGQDVHRQTDHDEDRSKRGVAGEVVRPRGQRQGEQQQWNCGGAAHEPSARRGTAADPDRPGQLGGLRRHRQASWPSRPRGRNMRTTSRTMKTISSAWPLATLLSSGTNEASLFVNDSISPSDSPPTNAPGRLVMPPRTAAVNATVSVVPVKAPGVTEPAGGTASRMPATPPSRPAIAHEMSEMRSTEMPTTRAAVASWLTARIAVPVRV